jgi:hypothetical protein
MHNKAWMILAIAAGGLAAGCANNDLEDRGATRQEGNLSARPGVDEPQRPYSPVMGDTTGGGQPRDLRTGGGAVGPDVTPQEQIDEKIRTRTNTPEGTGPIPGPATRPSIQNGAGDYPR